MENKKNLAKVALAALILASTAPVAGDAHIVTHGIVLAAGCASHGCAADSDDDSKSEDKNSQKSDDKGKGGSKASSSHTSAKINESQLLGMLNPQGKTIYQNLNPQGKALALQLANEDTYRDKNLAVKEAQRRSAEHKGNNH